MAYFIGAMSKKQQQHSNTFCKGHHDEAFATHFTSVTWHVSVWDGIFNEKKSLTAPDVMEYIGSLIVAVTCHTKIRQLEKGGGGGNKMDCWCQSKRKIIEVLSKHIENALMYNNNIYIF